MPACDPLKPFQTPVRVAGLNPAQAFMRPKLSADELTIYFTMRVNDVAKLARATRASRTDAFGAVTRISEVESSKSDRDPSASADHLTLFFSSTRTGDENLFVATRATPTSPWGQPTLVPAVNTKVDERDPCVRASEVWFSSPRAGSWEIYEAPFTGLSGVGSPRLVTDLVSLSGARYQPMVTEDGLAIVFVSERAGGEGDRDPWIARRTAPALPFSVPVPIVEVNSAADENGVWLSADGCRLYFSSDRGSDHDSLFVAERTL